MSENLVEASIQGTVLILEMKDPASRTALSRRMLSGLADAVEGAGADTLGIVITGGAGCFSAGADFRDLKGTSQDLEYDEAVAGLVASLLASDRIVVAAIEGPCMGAAADIALACDYRIAGEGSFMQIPAVRLGLLYNPDAIDRLRRRHRADTVARLLLAGERFDTQAAHQAGLFSRVVPQGDAVRIALEDLRKLEGRHSQAVRATKRLLADLEAGQADMARWQACRMELLDSEPRRLAIQQAHERFVNKPGTHR